MTERRVSVRLVAVGGSQVKAELEEIGRTGEASFSRVEAAADRTSANLARMSGASGNAAFRTQQLAFQLNDIGVSLAAGQNPLTVFIQQGSQIAQVYGAQGGGVGAVLADLAGLVRTVAVRFGPLLAVLGLAAAGVSEMQERISEATGVAVTFGDTALAIWQVVRDGLWTLVKPAVDAIGPWFGAAWDRVVETTVTALDLVINGVRVAVAAVQAVWEGGWRSVYGRLLITIDDMIVGIVGFGDRVVAVFQGAYDGAVAIWGSLPGAIGDFAYQAANSLIAGVESMLNAVVSRINSFIESLNAALALLPEWATGEGGVRIGTLDPVALGRIGNPFEGGAAAAGRAAAAAFEAALGRTYVQAPDLGLRARGEAEVAAGDAIWAEFGRQAQAIMGSSPTGEFFDAVSQRAVQNALARTAEEAGKAGAAGRKAGRDMKEGAEEASAGWQAVGDKLAEYAAQAMDLAGGIGDALTSAFKGAEDAIVEFVKTGKLDFRDMITSMIADLARLAARRFILGPLANALSGALGNLGGGLMAGVLHSGGLVGAPGPSRMVPALAFAGAPRMHSGGWAGLRPDEVPAILQRGERVLSRREAQAWGAGGVNVTIMARDAESFRQSRTQVAADIARAVSLGRRGM